MFLSYVAVVSLSILMVFRNMVQLSMRVKVKRTSMIHEQTSGMVRIDDAVRLLAATALQDDRASTTRQAKGKRAEERVRVRTTNDDNQTDPLVPNERQSVEHPRAVVFKVQAVDACRLARFEAMARLVKTIPMDVWILSDDAMQPEAASGFAAIASRNPRALFARTPAIDSTRHPAFTGHQGKRKIDLKMQQFAAWLNESKYEFAWYVEDDMVFTVEWQTFFGPAEDEAGSTDLVMQ